MVRVSVTREGINRVRDQYERHKQQHEQPTGFGAEPPAGLIPRGDGIYTTPEVIDPTDCANWDSSPWCGGNPFSNPLNNPASVDIKWGVNQCGAFVQATGTLLGVEGPTHTAAWIRPECRQKYEQSNPDYFDKPKPNMRLRPARLPDGIDPNQTVYAVFGWEDYFYEVVQYRGVEGQAIAWGYAADTAAHDIIFTPNSQGFDSLIVSCRCSGFVNRFANALYRVREQGVVNATEDSSFSGSLNGGIFFISKQTGKRLINQDFPFQIKAGGGNYPLLVYGRWGDIYAWFNNSLATEEGTSPPLSPTVDRQRYLLKQSVHRLLAYAPALDSPWKHPPPPPDDDRNCCMECCSSSQQNENNDLLREILRQVKKANQRIGSDSFPTSVPEHFNTQYEEDGTGKKPPQAKQIQNLRELVEWHATAMDGILGEWEIPIKITDIDPEKEGDQSKTIVLKNISEAVSDLYALAFDSHLQINQCLRMLIKTIVEAGSSKKAATQSFYLIKAVADYLDFKQKEKTIKIAMGFTPGKEKYEEFIDEFEQEIRIITFEENDKNSRSFADDLNTLLHAAAITRSVFFRRLNKDDIKGSMVELIKKMSDANKEVQKGMQTGEDDFDKFIKQAETQFAEEVNNPELVNPTKPYGVDYSNRPKIRRVRTGVEEDQQPGS